MPTVRGLSTTLAGFASLTLLVAGCAAGRSSGAVSGPEDSDSAWPDPNADQNSKSIPGRVTSQPFPAAPVGFKFGSTPEQFAETCRSMGGRTSRGSNCDGIPSESLPGYWVSADFCVGRLCGVNLFFDHGEPAYHSVHRFMRERYGEPRLGEGMRGDGCSAGDLPVLLWDWSSHYSETEDGMVILACHCGENGERYAVLTYMNPAATAAMLE